MASHLRIDRSKPTAAVESMKKVNLFLVIIVLFCFPGLELHITHLTGEISYHQAAIAVVKNDLSLIIFPEGTRSKNGRLLPFKKVLLSP